jgi:phosphopantothenoylcysteine synthetase/decarboxylase
MAHDRGHRVTLLTSHPDAAADIFPAPLPDDDRWRMLTYRTFEDLHGLMASAVAGGKMDAVIHSAAVSDYLAAGVFAPASGTHFDPATGHWHADATAALVDRAAGKVKSDEPELWIRLVRAPKLIDLVRNTWSFTGVLVKFKLEVGINEERLLEIAERSRVHSGADLMVANTLEGAATWAYLGPVEGAYPRIRRHELAARLLEAVEQRAEGRRHG